MHMLQMESPALAARGNPETVQASDSNNPEYALAQLRLQYLAQIFDMPAATAAVVADLAFGEASHD